MTSLQPCTVLTGANGGLGRGFLHHLDTTQTVILVGRKKDELNKLISDFSLQDRSHILVTDLSQTQSSVQALEALLKKEHLWIETLINNAGFGLYGPFETNDAQREQEMIAVNIATVTALAKLALPQMKQHGHGNILNVASVAAFFPGPFLGVYYATKTYVLSFSLALRAELAGTDIHITTLCPGPTQTHFAHEAQAEKASIFQGKLADPKDVAQFGIQALAENKAVAIYGHRQKLIIALTRFLPLEWTAQVIAKIQKPR